MNERSRPGKRSDSTSAFVTALEQTRLDTLLTEQSRPVGTSSPVYAPLLNQIIPPAGMALPPIEKPQQNDQSISSLENAEQSEPIQLSPLTFINTLYISIVLGSLLHSWWVLGGCLLIGLILTGLMMLSDKRETFPLFIATGLWLLFALLWGYVGWLVCDSYMPLIIHYLCAFIGFILGLIGYIAINGFVGPTNPKSAQKIKPVHEAKHSGLITFIDTVCISLVFGYLLHSWSILGASLSVGVILTGIIVFSVKDNIHAFNQTTVSMVWLLFALMWGYAGWLVCASYIPSIVHFLCAFIGFILGLIGYPLVYAILSPEEVKEEAIRDSED